MPISSVIPPSFKQEVLDGVHEASDDYKIALFTSSAALDGKTTHYAAQPGEVKGRGYTAGGIALTGRTSGTSGAGSYMTFADPEWSSASFTARGALIYNASKQNRAVAILNFGKDETCSNGNFSVGLPPAGPKAIVTIG